MKRLTLFFLAVLAAWALFALPAHDARFLNVAITYELHEDGSWDMTYEHQVRLDTYYAFNRALGETFIVYNPDFQKLEVLKSETTMTDGRKVASPPNAFNEVLPFAAHGFADFDWLREMVVTHVGLERGAVVDLKYRVHTKAGFFPVFSGREILSRDFPVDRYRLTINIPAGQSLIYRVFGRQTEAEVSNVSTGKLYTFELNSLPPAAHEPLSPIQAEAFIVFSSARNWEQTLALVSTCLPLPAALVEKVKKLQAQNPTWPDLLSALQNAVAVEVQNCSLGPETTGWRPRPLERVFQSNYGTRLEKALLLEAMLRKAGADSELLAVATGTNFAEDVPAMSQIGEYWLKTFDGSKIVYLDPCHEQDEFFPYRCQSFAAFNRARMELEKMPAANRDQNSVEISGTVALDPAGTSGSLKVSARGVFNRYAAAAESSAGFIEALLKKIFPVQKVEMKKLLLLSKSEFGAEVTFSGPWLKDIGSGFLNVDACRLPGLAENMVILDKRESPLALEGPFQVSLRLDIEPAAGLKLEYAAPNLERRNELGRFSRSLATEKNGSLRFSAAVVLEKGVVSPGDYPLLRELLLPYFAPDFWMVFRKEK